MTIPALVIAEAVFLIERELGLDSEARSSDRSTVVKPKGLVFELLPDI